MKNVGLCAPSTCMVAIFGVSSNTCLVVQGAGWLENCSATITYCSKTQSLMLGLGTLECVWKCHTTISIAPIECV